MNKLYYDEKKKIMSMSNIAGCIRYITSLILILVVLYVHLCFTEVNFGTFNICISLTRTYILVNILIWHTAPMHAIHKNNGQTYTVSTITFHFKRKILCCLFLKCLNFFHPKTSHFPSICCMCVLLKIVFFLWMECLKTRISVSLFDYIWKK